VFVEGGAPVQWHIAQWSFQVCTTPPSYIWVHACSRGQTHRHIDAGDHDTFRVVYDSRNM